MSKALVTYFSAEGTTARVAKDLAKKLDADLFEIKPEVPYTSADIKWTNPLARCNREKLGKKDVPVSGIAVHAFATSGGSGIGKTAEKLTPYVKGAASVDAKLVRSAAEVIIL